jgi:SepF-like predicted cell division protein (DUF552 family)
VKTAYRIRINNYKLYIFKRLKSRIDKEFQKLNRKKYPNLKHQGNAKQNHNEISAHHKMTIIKRVKISASEDVEKGNSCTVEGM